MIKKYWHFFLAALLFIVIHHQTWSYDFVWDDRPTLELNPLFEGPLSGVVFRTQMQHLGLNPLELKGIRINSDSFRPLLNIQFWIEHSLFGWNKIVLHSLSLFWIIILLILSQWAFHLVIGSSRFFILLLVAHPLLVEPAAYVAARSDTMSVVFALFAFIASIYVLKFKSRPILWGVLAILSYLVALGFKEGVIFLPLAILLILRPKMEGKRFWGLALGFAAVGILYVLARSVLAITATSSFVSSSFLNLPNYWLQYLIQFVFPFEISTERPLFVAPFYLGWVGIGLVFLLCWRRQWLNFFGAVFSSLILLWPSSLAIEVFRIQADRYFLLSLVILCGAITAVLSLLRRAHYYYIGLMVVWMFFSLESVGAWKDNKSLFLHAVQKSGTSSAYFRFASSLSDFESIPFFEKAVQLDPTNSKALNALGVQYMRFGGFRDAEQVLLQATEQVNDINIKTTYFLGIAQIELGKIAEGCKNLRQSLETDPRDLMIQRDIGRHCTKNVNSGNPR